MQQDCAAGISTSRSTGQVRMHDPAHAHTWKAHTHRGTHLSSSGFFLGGGRGGVRVLEPDMNRSWGQENVN